MRIKALAAFVALSTLLIPQSASAEVPPSGGGAGAGGRTLDVSSWIGGAFTDGRPGNYRSPCGGVGIVKRPIWEHTYVDPFEELEALTAFKFFDSGQKLYSGMWKHIDGEPYRAGLSYTLCHWNGEGDPPIEEPWNGAEAYVGAYWYPLPPDPRIMIPSMFRAVQENIGAPVLTWPNMSPTGDWLFVQVPMAYRLKPIGFVKATATVSNELGTASAWIQATPTRIDVDVDGQLSSCLIGDAMTDHGADENPPCAVVFDEVARGLPLTVTLTWTITSSIAAPNLPATLTTTSTGAVDVAEIQALVEPGR